MNMAVIVFWMSSVVIVVIGVGVIYTVARDLLTDSSRK
jgi:cytochrome c-type biogenesis protein CcmH/NrfF